jgi:hypothetical protein
MRKIQKFVAVISFVMSSLALADVAQQVPVMTSTTADQLQTEDVMNQNYNDIANLKTRIEFIRTKLSVEQLQQELSSMQGKETVSFKVLRIEGFDDIKVWLLGVDGSVVEAGPGDVVFGHYRISQVKPSEVRVINITSGTLYTVPFAKAQDVAAASKATSSAQAITSVTPVNQSETVASTTKTTTK